MHRRRALVVALALLVTACGSTPTPRVAIDSQLAAATVTTTTAPAFTPEQVRYLAAQAAIAAERVAFLTAVAAVRAAVPQQLRVIMWCEAGSYLSLPRYETNYAAMTHGHDGASGGAQMLGSTWLTWAREIGVDVARWPRAYLAPAFVQDLVATHGYHTRGTSPWGPSASCWR